MAQAKHDSITNRREFFAAAAVTAPLAIIAPQLALAGGDRTPIERMWAIRPTLVARRELAADGAEQLPFESGDPREAEYNHAHLAVWNLDDQIMAATAMGPRDLAIKALVVRERNADDLKAEPFLRQLVESAITFAVFPAR